MSEGGKYAVDVVKLKIPILGAILGKTAIARFTRTLGTLISRRRADPRRDQHHQGNRRQRGLRPRPGRRCTTPSARARAMADPLRATKVCDAIVVNMIDVGEETGDLDKMLMKVADNYDNDVDVLVSSLISILEPVMVVILGVIVGFIVIALFMPMITPDPGHQQSAARSEAIGFRIARFRIARCECDGSTREARLVCEQVDDDLQSAIRNPQSAMASRWSSC